MAAIEIAICLAQKRFDFGLAKVFGLDEMSYHC